MKVIRANTMGHAHEHVVRLIMRKHIELTTEDGEVTWEYPETVCIHVTQAINEPQVSSCCMFGKRFMEEYVKKVVEITPYKGDGTDAVYTYGNRLRDYPIIDSYGSVRGNGRKDGIDQLEHVIGKLKNSLETRRAVIHTWNVELDGGSTEPPCLQLVQFLVRNGLLNVHAYFRSNDMLSAWGANVFALRHLQRMVAKRIGTGSGYIETISISAHLYPVRDAYELKRFEI